MMEIGCSREPRFAQVRCAASRPYWGRNSSVAWLAKSMSGCGHTPKSTVTPVHSAMARALRAGTGTAWAARPAPCGLLVGQEDLLVERRHRAAAAAGVAHASPPRRRCRRPAVAGALSADLVRPARPP